MAQSNPMNHIAGNHIPFFLLNSEDDVICLKDNIQEDLPEKLGNDMNIFMVKTTYGSHISFREGYFGEKDFLTRLTFDFFDAVRNS